MFAMLLSTVATGLAGPAPAAPLERPPAAITHAIAYTADLGGVAAWGGARKARYLDNLSLSADADLDRLWGWRGLRVHGSVLANHGGRPNDDAGTLQGVDNIEVGKAGVRLFELWVEKDLGAGGGSVLAGLYDVNSEFYRSAASGLLLGPQFGIGSELAATGPNGPSIFPSTAPAIRVRLGRPDGLHMQAAAIDAAASSLGDAGGIDTRFDQGALMVAEAGWTGPVRIAGGAWRYSRRQPDIRRLAPDGQPAGSRSQGAYLLAEGRIFGDDQGRQGTAFVRLGVSDGRTTAFRGGWQAGVNIDRVVPSRPDSALAIGVHHAALSEAAQANIRDLGVASAHAEQGLEITYADRLGPIGLQPDLQVIAGAGGLRGADTVVVTTLRFSLALP